MDLHGRFDAHSRAVGQDVREKLGFFVTSTLLQRVDVLRREEDVVELAIVALLPVEILEFARQWDDLDAIKGLINGLRPLARVVFFGALLQQLSVCT